jgi:predicted nucleotidyltransferase
MAGKRGFNGEVLREQLAQEAARLIIDHGMHDYGQAKRKAAQRFGVRESNALPSNAEIESSVIERQRIFDPEQHQHRLMSMRVLAAEIMLLLEEFEPRLVGPVLAGTVTVYRFA